MSQGDSKEQREAFLAWTSKILGTFLDTREDGRRPPSVHAGQSNSATCDRQAPNIPTAGGHVRATTMVPGDGATSPGVQGRTCEPEEPLPTATLARSDCRRCVYFRESRSVVDLAFEALGPLARSRVSARRPELKREERESAASEREEYAEYCDGEIERWSSRPSRHSYCGFREFRGEWHVHEVKNRDGGCQDFSERAPARASSSCGGCKHLLSSQTDLLTVLEACLLTGGDAGKQLFAERVKVEVEVWSELDLTDAIAGGGVVPSEPRFLPICGAYSQPQRYVVGPVVNTAHLCPRWESRLATESVAGGGTQALWNAVQRTSEIVGESYAAKMARYGTSDAVDLVQFIDVEREKFQDARVQFVAAALAELRFPHAEANSIALSARIAFSKSDKVEHLRSPSL
jgi:hypothetical protein